MRPDDGAAVILAAGSSQRFGADKRMVALEGQPMILHALEPYINQLQSVYVVLKPDDPVETVLPPTIQIIEAPDAYLGMGHSLAAAAHHLPDLKWFLVGLADMPWIRTDTIHQIIAHIRELEDAIIRPSFKGEPGHPVGFSGNFLEELKTLSGDVGAKRVLSQNGNKIVDLPVTDEAILRDVDTPDQIRR